MLKCSKCGSEIPDNVEQCPTCRLYAGPPNVRAANRAEQVQALEERYQRAFDKARASGCLSLLEKFDQALQHTSAVINVDIVFLDYFFRSSKTLYTTYERGVAGRIRLPAELDDDRKRLGVGAILFGAYAHQIIYAALSLNGSGLQSYGPYAMKLRDIAISSRATLLENNSFDFVPKHDLRPGDRLPLGRIASWDNRHKLAVAKLAERITPRMTESQFASLLLLSEGNRATDEFIEVHIYETFNNRAVESIRGRTTDTPSDEQGTLRRLKQYLKSLGIAWIEE